MAFLPTGVARLLPWDNRQEQVRAGVPGKVGFMASGLEKATESVNAPFGQEALGFVQEGMPPSGFCVKRTATARPVWGRGAWYFRVRELADVLGMHQPQRLAAAVRSCGGNVVSGRMAEELRDGDDAPRAAFVSAGDALCALDVTFGLGRLDTGMVQPVRDALAAYAAACGPG